MILPVAPASKTTLQKTGIASNILEAISQGNESQHTLEKCTAYSQPFGDYAQVNEFQILRLYRKLVQLYIEFTEYEIVNPVISQEIKIALIYTAFLAHHLEFLDTLKRLSVILHCLSVIVYTSGWQTTDQIQPTTCLVIRFYWSTAGFIHLHLVQS